MSGTELVSLALSYCADIHLIFVQNISLYFVPQWKILYRWHSPVRWSHGTWRPWCTRKYPSTHLYSRCTNSVQLSPTCLAAVHAVLLRPTYSSSSYGSKAASARKATGFTLIQPGNNKRICSKCNCYQRIQKNQTKKSLRLKCRHIMHGFQDNKNKF